MHALGNALRGCSILGALAVSAVASAQTLESINTRLESVYGAGESLSADESVRFGAVVAQMARDASTPTEMTLLVGALFDIASLSERVEATEIRADAYSLTPRLIESGLSDERLWEFLWRNYRRPREWMSPDRRTAEAPELRRQVRLFRETAPTDRERAMLLRLEAEQWLAAARDSSLGILTDADKESAEATLSELHSKYGDRMAPLAGATYSAVTEQHLHEIRNLAVGSILPDFAGEDLYGEPIRFSDLRGNIVLISGWANWCLPCRAMFPVEIALVEELRDEPFVLLGVNDDRDREQAIALAEQSGLNYRSVWSDSASPTVIESLHMTGLPAFFVLDAEGRIIARALSGGEATADYLHSVVRDALRAMHETD